MYSATLVSQAMAGEVVTEDSYNFFHLLPLVALYSHFLINQALLTSTNRLNKRD